MPSFLGDYGGNYGRAATDRVTKFHRAMYSVLEQTFTNWQLVVVSDGCEQTWAEKERYMERKEDLLFKMIPKQRLWSEVPRNSGLDDCNGTYVVYLDTDDYFGPDHLQRLADGLEAAEYPDVAFFDDWIWSAGDGQWVQHIASADRANGLGTSNIAHAVDLGLRWPPITYRWPSNGYDQDRQFVNLLKKAAPPVRIQHGSYRVCHIPKQYDI
jgi:glycosyltransferase involved in cell wall biosynthesis